MTGMLGLESYTYMARVRPVLLASLPAVLALLSWTEAAFASWGVLGSLVLAVGLPYALGEKAADAGRRAQASLWMQWGGSPTRRFLRHRTSSLNALVLRRTHRALHAITGVAIPSAAEEASDPAGADVVYGLCEERLRVIARERQGEYRSVFRANAEYGYRRNLWAIRRWGWLAVLAATASTIAHTLVFGFTALSLVAAIGAVVGATYLRGATEEWVREAGELYAMRLVESCEEMAAVTKVTRTLGTNS